MSITYVTHEPAYDWQYYIEAAFRGELTFRDMLGQYLDRHGFADDDILGVLGFATLVVKGREAPEARE